MKVALFFLLPLALAGNIYPEETFIFDLDPTDLYDSAYCLADGEPSLEQGATTQSYFMVQDCETEEGIITPFANSMTIGFVASALDLGLLSAIKASYGLNALSDADTFSSIHYDSSRSAVVIASSGSASGQSSAMTFQPLSPSDAGPLNTTSSAGATIIPLLNHVYLARVTTAVQTRLNVETGMLVKLYIQSAAAPWRTRWSIYWSDWELPEEDDDDGGDDETAEQALGLAITAFLLVIFVVVYLVYHWWKARKGGGDQSYLRTENA